MLGEQFQRSVWIIVATIILLATTAVGDLPKPLQRCQFDDEACLITQAGVYVRNFRDGIPELGVPSLNPMDLGTLNIVNSAESSSLKFKLKMTNTMLHNLPETVVFKSVRGFSQDLSKPMKLILGMASPDLEIHADYDVNGRILILPVISTGRAIINLYNVQAKSRMTVEPQKRDDGHTYLNIKEFRTVAKIGNGHFNMSNLFNNNVELRDSTLNVLNGEWGTLAADIQPVIIAACDRVFRHTLQKLWDAIPYDEFFQGE